MDLRLARRMLGLCLWLLLAASPLLAQKKLPVIRANSTQVAIRDGAFLDREAWTLAPDARPDVYTADRTRATKSVTFYTDLDSIRFRVKPGESYDFVILLQGRDSCFTRIQSAIPSAGDDTPRAQHSDTIPFQLMDNNAICVQAVLNERDTLNLHFDAGSFDIRLTSEAILKKTQLLAHQDILGGKAKPDFNDLANVSTVQLGSVKLNSPTVLATGVTATGMDGRFGWNLFEGKVVEINYDAMCLVIHSQLPRHRGYARSRLTFLRSFPCIDGEFKIGREKYAGTFLLDTGSDQALILDSNWVATRALTDQLALIRSSELSDPRGVKYVTKIVRVPEVRLQRWVTTGIPAYLLPSRNPVGFEVHYVGNDLMKRFNSLLDFKKDHIYLKPNHMMTAPFLGNS